MRFRSFSTSLFVGLLSFSGLIHCGSDDEDKPEAGGPGSACNPDASLCADGLVCSELKRGGHGCYLPFVLHGQVRDAQSGEPLEGALVMAVNDDGIAITDVARTGVDGNYEFSVPVLRNDDGSPATGSITLRAAAQDYLPFPSGARVALPIDVSGAMSDAHHYAFESTLTRIDLIPLASGDRTMISGSIVALAGAPAGAGAGVLVVAAGADGAVSGLSDRTGAFSIFNVPAGDYELSAYGDGVQIESKSITVAKDPVSGLELHQLDQPTSTVSGNVQIVNAPGGSQTSVVLVVEDTFDAAMARGEVPRGLRAPGSGEPAVSGAFSIAGVPNGRYVVLAAFENDVLVRDPDTNIAGTDFVHIEVSSAQPTLAVSEAFKVTEALATVSPGGNGPEAVSKKPELTWVDDSSEDWYDLRVFDALGNEVWNSLEFTAAKGSSNVSVPYDGPLDPGMYYQFRVSSWRQPGDGDSAPISATEDLRGVFYLPLE